MPAPVDWSWGEAIDVKPFNETSSGMNNPLLQTLDQTSTPNQNIMSAPSCHPPIPTSVDEARDQVPMGRADVVMKQSFQLKRTNSMAGRKRSCGEISDEDSTPKTTSSSSGCASSSPTKPSQEPIYGPGMTLTYPNDSSGAWEAGSQTGTWAEELAARLQASDFPEDQQRPKLGESRKSMRMDRAASNSGLDDVRREMLAIRDKDGEPVAPFASPAAGNDQVPSHDEASIALGVGWSNIPVNATMLAAARGWARYVETAYPLRSAKMVWRNEGLSALLASAVSESGSPGYYLFDENLSQGRLVAKSWEKCLDNLRSQPYAFDGETIMRAEEHRRLNMNMGMGMGMGMEMGIEMGMEMESMPSSTSQLPPVSQEIAMEVD